MFKCFRVLLMVISVVITLQANSLSSVNRSFDELVSLAEVIVIGEVGDIEGRWEGANIFTLVTFRNLEIIKGNLEGNSYQIRQLGGSVPPDTQLIAGAPHFKPGVRYVLFIRGNRRHMFPFVGVRQGIYRVFTDSSGREHVIGLDKTGAGTKARVLTGPPPGAVPLSDFRLQIKQKLDSP